MTAATCQACDRVLAEGEMAWATDWMVAEVASTTVAYRNETRYTCDDCEATA